MKFIVIEKVAGESKFLYTYEVYRKTIFGRKRIYGTDFKDDLHAFLANNGNWRKEWSDEKLQEFMKGEYEQAVQSGGMRKQIPQVEPS